MDLIHTSHARSAQPCGRLRGHVALNNVSNKKQAPGRRRVGLLWRGSPARARVGTGCHRQPPPTPPSPPNPLPPSSSSSPSFSSPLPTTPHPHLTHTPRPSLPISHSFFLSFPVSHLPARRFTLPPHSPLPPPMPFLFLLSPFSFRLIFPLPRTPSSVPFSSLSSASPGRWAPAIDQYVGILVRGSRETDGGHT